MRSSRLFVLVAAFVALVLAVPLGLTMAGVGEVSEAGSGNLRMLQQQGDYDADDDGLIDIRNLAQLNAVRYDLDGDGLLVTDADAYNAAFPRPASGSMGCPHDGCIGYELAADLSFDTNGNGQIDQGDDYWNEGAGWLPIGDSGNPFNATFDGGSFTITDLYINRGDANQIGLFGRAEAGSAIRRVRLVSVNVSGQDSVGGLVGINSNGGAVTSSYTTGTVSGRHHVGGLVGWNDNTASVTASYALGSVAGSSSNVGGLVGLNRVGATVAASYATGSVTGGSGVGGLVGSSDNGAVTASYATGSVTGGSSVGGLVGHNSASGGVITASYATGSVSGSSSVGGLVGSASNGAVTASYATGSVTGGSIVGGLVGSASNFAVSESYWDIQTSGQTESSGGEGKTTAELQSPTAYTGIYSRWNVDLNNFDLDDDLATGGDDPWDFGGATEYPTLKPTVAKPDTQTGTGGPSTHSTDRAALEALYDATAGANWTNSQNWLSDAPVSQWHGVIVDDSGRVSKLRLRSNGLSGALPAELGNLSNLQELSLRDNQLTGQIPAELGNLSNLRGLFIGQNRLTGPIPATLGNLASLDALHLQINRLSGPIPAQLGNLSNLSRLSLRDNQLAGTIPPALGNLANLRGLWLYGNQLTGAIPEALVNLDNLTDLYLARNGLSGCIPSGLQDVPENDLYHLGLAYCADTDLPQITDREALIALYNNTDGPNWRRSDKWNTGAPMGEWHGVTTDGQGQVIGLDLTYNRLAGNLPGEVGTLDYLQWLNLRGNRLSGDIPSELGNLTSLISLDLAGNRLNGAIPPELGNLVNLTRLWLHRNQLVGEIPPELSRLANLRELNLSANDLGYVPGEGHPTGYTFSGEIPAVIGNLNSIRVLNLSNNHLVGNIPASLGNLNNLEIMNFRGNRLNGEIPPELGRLRGLKALNLSDNALSGTVPAELNAGLHSLNVLNLSKNNLTRWWLPSGAGNGLGNLEVLNISDNELRGALPPGLSSLSNLRGLGLAGNQLTGAIPAPLGNLGDLEHLDLGSNLLRGGIPDELGNLPNLSVLDLGVNTLSGAIPSELGSLHNLDVLDLGGNLLSGEIPEELDNLPLIILDLYDNQNFTGCLPIEPEKAQRLGLEPGVRGLPDSFCPTPAELAAANMEAEVLAKLYLHTRGDNWSNATNWFDGSDHPHGNDWHGVYTNDEGRVTGLDLRNNNLRGWIPSDLQSLDHLRWVKLGGNDVCVPGELGDEVQYGEALIPGGNEKAGSQDDNLVSGVAGAGVAFGESDIYSYMVVPTAQFLLQMTKVDDLGNLVVPTGEALKGALTQASVASPQPTAEELAMAERMKRYNIIRLGYPVCPPEPPEGIATEDQNYETDKAALIALYNSTGGANWKNNNNWLSDQPIGEWHGVHTELQGTVNNCNDEQSGCRVARIDLSVSQEASLVNLFQIPEEQRHGNGLIGTIPAELGNLGELKSLNLSRNSLTGSIPAHLGNLRQLQELALNDNRLSNGADGHPIPPELGNATRLTDLLLQNNQLSGWIPLELGMLSESRLRKMNIDTDGDTSLKGCLPAQRSISVAQSVSEFLDTVALTAVTWQIGPSALAGTKIAGFARGATFGVKLTKYAEKFFGKHMGKFTRLVLTKFQSAVKWGDDLPQYKQVFLATYAQSTVENYLGANAGPVGQASALNIGISEPIAERISTAAELVGWDLGGEIVMDKVWCGG